MKLRRYCVTVMDNWTPARVFWTYANAVTFYRLHQGCANLFHWERGGWQKIASARSR